jgi:hypothetical protein
MQNINSNQLIQDYVKKLVDNLPAKKFVVTENIDVVLDGGAFNGGYLLGALYFLEEMEKRKYIKVKRISGCSVGSAAAFFYLLGRLDLMDCFHDFAINQLQTNFSLDKLVDYQEILKDKLVIPSNICEIMNRRLFITYNNIKDKKTVVKSTYKNSEDMMQTIFKSCYVPFLVGNSLLYKEKYMDGLNPYVFNIEKHKNRKILYLDLFGYDKFKYIVNVKNEKNGFHRTLSGLLDIHNFYIKECDTEMCSYVNDWSIYHKTRHQLKKTIEYIILYSVYLLALLKKYLPEEIENSLLYKILSKIIYEVYIVIIQNQCL